METINLSHYPQSPWVYIFKDKRDNILYIWKAKNLKKRISQYFSPWSVWKQEMVAQAEKIEFIIVENESESLYLESNLIKKHLPPFNNMLKWANAYAYIKLTKHPIPQIFITRKKINDWATYIWPKHNTRELKKFLQYLRQIIQYRTCPLSQFNQWKVCSDYYFWLCKWRCNGKTEEPDYPKLITSFFKGNTKPIEQKIKILIDEAIKVENFEWAAKLRDIYLQIWNFTEKQSIEFAKSFSWYLLQIREIGTRRVYVLLHFYEGKMIDIIRHHFEKDEIDQDTMLASFSSEFWEFKKENWYYATTHFTRTKWEEKEMLQLFNDFFDSYLLVNTIQWSWIINELLKTLQNRYSLSNFPYQVECLDISHLWGDRTSWWLSAITWWLPDKKWYRKYKIITSKNDDYLSLKEVLIRRFKISGIKGTSPQERESNVFHLPDVFILDGWKGQLGILNELLKEYPQFQKIIDNVQFCSLGKWEARHKATIWKTSKKSNEQIGEKLYTRNNWKIIENDFTYDDADKILIKLRDEAHRFSNAYRKKQEEISFKKEKEKIEKKKKKL